MPPALCGVLAVLAAAGRLVLRQHLGGPALPVPALGQPDLAGAVLAAQDDIDPAARLDFLPAVVEVVGQSHPRYAGRWQ